MEVQYLTADHLSGFENYKYSARDTSPLSIYVMHPFWNKVVTWCPKSIAPNLITFVGFLFTAINVVLFAYYDPSFYASSDDHPEHPPIPRWVFAAGAFNIFIAYTLDGIDGKQARRTSTSGPLGELFDHGLDSWTTVLIPVCMYSVFGRTTQSVTALRMYFCIWNVFWNFYLSHWEKYNTGVLFLPWGYDVSMVISVLINMVTAMFGHEAWNFLILGRWSSGQMFEATFYICALGSNLPVCVWNIYKSYRDRTGKMHNFWEANRPLVAAIILMVTSIAWALTSPADIMNLDPRMVYLLTGTIFSNICCRLIVCQMSSMRCELFNWLLVPFAGMAGVALLVPAPLSAPVELAMLYTLSAVVLAVHCHYGACVVRQMCRHFKVDCFRIRRRDD